MITRDQLITLYEHMYQMTSGDRRYTYHPTNRTIERIDKFLSRLSESHGEEWLFDFMCFGFHRFVDLKTRFGKGIVKLDWVIGKKPVERFNSASREQLHHSEMFRLEYGIKNVIRQHIKLGTADDYRNRERRRFYNTERGLLHCVENQLYEPSNKNCVTCKNRSECSSGEIQIIYNEPDRKRDA